MKKRLILSIAVVAAVAVGIVGMSAFEAHIINVTAQIENALAVSTNEILFGTVFPQELLVEQVGLELSGSFMAEDRVDDVQYIIKQKPKPKHVPDRELLPIKPNYNDYLPGGLYDGALYPNWIDNDRQRGEYCHTHVPADAGDPLDLYYINCYPNLCPYLSKHDADPDDANDTPGVPAFHDPEVTILDGYLAKSVDDVADLWDIDLAVPCFEGSCAQDWPIFVASQNDQVDPFDYVLPPTLEHEVFGCDLWFEVTGISLPETRLTVIKEVVNINGGTAVAGDFTINVAGINVSTPSFPGEEAPGTTVTLDPGAYDVTEDLLDGYTPNYGADCSGDIADGESRTCIITNNEDPIEPSFITVEKIVENEGVGTLVAANFQMQIDGGDVDQDTPIEVAAGQHNVGEADSQYAVTYGGECDSNGDVTVAEGESKSCTVTNTFTEFGTIAITKLVENNGVGTLNSANFQMRIDGADAAQDVLIPVAVGTRTVGEIAQAGYEMTFTGGHCDSIGEIVVAAGQDYTCEVTNTFEVGTITVTKVVTKDDGGTAEIVDFNLFVAADGVDSGVANDFAPGTYTISESGVSGYLATFTGDCDNPTHEITIAAGESKTCTITNDDIAPVVTLIKDVVGGTAQPTDFFMRIDGGAAIPHGGSESVSANTDHQINEDPFSGYVSTGISGTDCPTALDQNFQLTPGQSVTCTITNEFQP